MYALFKKTLPIYLIAVMVFSPLLALPQHASAQESGGTGAIIQAACEVGGYLTSALGGLIGDIGGEIAGEIDLGSVISSSVPVTETKSSQILSSTQVVAGEQSSETCTTILGTVLASLVEILRKQLLDMVVDQIINWIQGGGTPQFITDWSAFLKDASDQAFGIFIEEIGVGFLCDSFNYNVQIALLPVPKFSQRASCTLSQIVNNIENFYGDFRNGGWITYASSLQYQNNYYGALFLAQDELTERRIDAALAAQNEGIAGGGFLSTKSCTKDAEGNDIPGTCKITTPGDTIANLVSKAVGSDLDYIINAKELSQYIAAISNALINRLIVEGVSGLQSLTTDNKPPGGFIDSFETGDCAGIPSPAYETCLNYVTGGWVTSEKEIFQVAVTDFASTTQYLIDLRTDAQFFLTDSYNQLTNHVIALQNLLASFNGLTCTNFSVFVTSISTEITNSTILANAIANDSNLNQDSITQLIDAKNEVLALKNDAWVPLTDIQGELEALGLLDETATLAFKNNTDIQNAQIKDANFVMLTTFNDNLQQCLLGL